MHLGEVRRQALHCAGRCLCVCAVLFAALWGWELGESNKTHSLTGAFQLGFAAGPLLCLAGQEGGAQLKLPCPTWPINSHPAPHRAGAPLSRTLHTVRAPPRNARSHTHRGIYLTVPSLPSFTVRARCAAPVLLLVVVPTLCATTRPPCTTSIPSHPPVSFPATPPPSARSATHVPRLRNA